MDLETQDHILNYQLPVAITKYNVGLVIMDSLTSNYRAEHTEHSILALSNRSTALAKLGHMFRNLAVRENIAIVIANQVSDRFETVETIINDVPRSGLTPAVRESGVASPIPRNRTDILGPSTQSPYDAPSSSPASSQYPPEDDKFAGSYLVGNPARNDLMSLLHQERFFTGWGDTEYPSTSSLKTPALGYFWSTQIACRIALKKETRSMFVPWDGTYPLSTPLEQMGPPQEPVEKVSEVKSAFATARQTHTGEVTSVAPISKEEKFASQSPKEPSPTPVPRPASPILPEPEQITRRIMKVVFAPWTAGSREQVADGHEADSITRPKNSETGFEIWKGGLRSIDPET